MRAAACCICHEYPATETTTGPYCVEHLPADYPRCPAERCCLAAGHDGNHQVKLYPVTDPAIIAWWDAEVDVARAVALSSGLCAMWLGINAEVCTQPPDHTGSCGNARWVRRGGAT